MKLQVCGEADPSLIHTSPPSWKQQAPYDMLFLWQRQKHGHTSTLQAFACVICTNIMLANAKPMAKPRINQAEGGREEFLLNNLPLTL